MNVLIIGDGNAGKYHKKAYLESGCEIIGQTDERTDYRKFIRDADIVSICSPDKFHFEQTCEAIRLGKHVMCEKPPCLRADELKYLMERTGKINFAVNLPLPWNPEFVEVATKIPELGKIYMIEAEYNYGRKSKLLDGWRASPDYSMVLGAGIHMVDLMLWYMGQMPTGGAAFGVSTTKARVDSCQAIMKFPNGAIGRLGINGGYEGVHQHKLSIYGDRMGINLVNTEEVDKTPGIKEFVKMCEANQKIDNTRLWNTMMVLFQIESQVP